jgi:predicted NUDIX family NTP pyrophosphohydrolase
VVAKRSAGLLLFRRVLGDGVEVLLGHMGGPLWAGRDSGGWSIPKGEYEPGETALDAARREFEEELGLRPPDGDLLELGQARQRSGKIVTVWAVAGDLDPGDVVPGTFAMEWPRGSGQVQEFPEIDRAGWFGLEQARDKIIEGQRPFLDRLEEHVSGSAGAAASRPWG